MSQSDLIKEIAKYGLENDQEKLLDVLETLIEHSRKSKKVNFAIQLQSILKDSIRHQKTSSLTPVGSSSHVMSLEDREVSDFVLEKITSDYRFSDLICNDDAKKDLDYFIQEHRSIDLLRRMELPVANKVIFHGPSGCGKTLASYVLSGELNKLMYVVNLGAIVSSKLGETSKNLAKVFKRAASENSVIFLDEFDSLGKVRDYNQDHGEMKRIVNTILQLFDFMPQECIVIAATNQSSMIDDALMRRFDVNIRFELPSVPQINQLIQLTLKNSKFSFDRKSAVAGIVKECVGLSYYSIQKTLMTAIKRSLFEAAASSKIEAVIDTQVWLELVRVETKALKRSTASPKSPTYSANKASRTAATAIKKKNRHSPSKKLKK